jgi:hypothetical protein
LGTLHLIELFGLMVRDISNWSMRSLSVLPGQEAENRSWSTQTRWPTPISLSASSAHAVGSTRKTTSTVEGGSYLSFRLSKLVFAPFITLR